MESNEPSTGFGLLLIAKGVERKRQKNAFNCKRDGKKETKECF